MKVIEDDLWLCTDCLFAAVNDDYTGLDYSYSKPEAESRERAIRKGLADLGPNLVYNADSETSKGMNEFSHRPCDCCGSALAGARERFAVLG